MIVKWKPAWYELDQSIVVGDIDLFYLSGDYLYFWNDLIRDNDCEVKAEILSISHSELGDIKGIITIGLDYSIYLSNGSEIIVNAEESPGDIVNSECVVREWDFESQMKPPRRTVARKNYFSHDSISCFCVKWHKLTKIRARGLKKLSNIVFFYTFARKNKSSL